MNTLLSQRLRGQQQSLHKQRRHAARPVLARPVVLGSAGRQQTKSAIVCSASGYAHPGEEATPSGSDRAAFVPMMSVPNVTLARAGGGGGNMGSGSSLGAVMERSKMSFVMPTPTQQAPKLDDGGDGGDIGKHNHNGGGGGDGGGDDDDDFFNEEGDGEGDGEGEGSGNPLLRTVVPESYDKFSLGAVFAEWMRTVADLPLIIRRAVEMGLFSSAQLVRFFSMDVRPNLVRSVSRSLPPSWARDFVGRLMADPAFMQKMVLESAFASAASLWYEYRARGENFKKELDLVLINTLGMAVATASTVWLVSPTRSYGNVHKFPWQQMLDQLPNCVFDASGPLRQYSHQARAASFFTKAAELSAVGLLTGTLTSLLSTAAVELHKKYDPSFEPSIPVPEVARSSAGLAAFFAISANTRYQLLAGMDRYLFGHSNYLWAYLGATGAARAAGQYVSEQHRAVFQGLPDPSTFQQRKRVVRRKVIKKKVVAAAPVTAAVVTGPSDTDMAAPMLLAATAAAGSEMSSASQPELHVASSPVPASAPQGEFLDQVLSESSASPLHAFAPTGLEAVQAGAEAPSSLSDVNSPSDVAALAMQAAASAPLAPGQVLASISSADEVLSSRREGALVGGGQR